MRLKNMLIIYYDVGGAHSVQAAAGIHLNILPNDRVPEPDELFRMIKFDNTSEQDYGRLIYIGNDEFDNQIYTLSCQYASKVMIPALRDMHRIAGGRDENLLLVSTMETINIYMKIGGFTSRRLKWVGFGRPIVVKGTLKAYQKIAKLVAKVKADLPQIKQEKYLQKGDYARAKPPKVLRP